MKYCDIVCILASFLNLWEAFSLHKPQAYVLYEKISSVLISNVLNTIEPSLLSKELYSGILIVNFLS